MKKIQQFFDKRRVHFEKDGKYSKYKAIFDAFETFFFIPGIITRQGPHVRDSLDVKRFMGMVMFAVMPLVLFGIYNTGHHTNLASKLEAGFFSDIITGLTIVLPIYIVTFVVGLAWEALFATVRGHSMNEGFFVSGMLFPLILPPTIPLWQVAVGISFGVVIGKEVFGGTGRNFLNPALTGRAFLYFAYPASMSGDNVWTLLKNIADNTADVITGATPLALSAMTDAGSTIEAALNKAGFTFSTLFMGFHSGSIGETSTLLCLVGAIFLVATGIASYRIMVGGFIGLIVTGFILNMFSGFSNSPWLTLNPFYHMVMGGFAFGIIFMATDPVSAPGMEGVKWIYGFLIGALTVIIRAFNPAYVEGTMMAILFMNMFAPLLDHIEIKMKLKKRIPNV